MTEELELHHVISSNSVFETELFFAYIAFM